MKCSFNLRLPMVQTYVPAVMGNDFLSINDNLISKSYVGNDSVYGNKKIFHRIYTKIVYFV